MGFIASLPEVSAEQIKEKMTMIPLLPLELNSLIQRPKAIKAFLEKEIKMLGLYSAYSENFHLTDGFC
jgi:hypothetical protein